MKQVTLCLIINKDRENKILLGMKKTGFGAGWYNGFGGKPKDDEPLEKAAIRELYEEVRLKTSIEHLKKVGELSFTFPYNKEWDQVVHVYLVDKWNGNPIESEEMKPEWFSFASIPYAKMWEADKHWLPHILDGKYVTASFTYGKNKEILNKELSVK